MQTVLHMPEKKILYVSGEESARQLKLRADRLSDTSSDCLIVCETSVDLPIPGSPPIRTREPCTSPPPNTRFSSSSCILMRGSSSASISLSASGLGFCVSMPDTGRRLAGSFRTISSTYVFHSPHDGHLPTHFGEDVYKRQVCGSSCR